MAEAKNITDVKKVVTEKKETVVTLELSNEEAQFLRAVMNQVVPTASAGLQKTWDCHSRAIHSALLRAGVDYDWDKCASTFVAGQLYAKAK